MYSVQMYDDREIQSVDRTSWNGEYIDESIDRRYVVYSMAKRERGQDEAD